MSGFLGTTSGTAGVGIQQARKDHRLISEWFDGDDYRFIDEDDAWAFSNGFRSKWWPGRGSLDASGGEWLPCVWYDKADQTSGGNGRLGFSGYTRDVNGVILGGCTVRLFRTSDGALMDTVVSDATTGWFSVNTPYYPDAHFYTAHKAGTPEVAGASPSNLIPS